VSFLRWKLCHETFFFRKRQQTTTTSIGFWLLVSIDSDFVGVTVLGKELKDYTRIYFSIIELKLLTEHDQTLLAVYVLSTN